MSSHTLIGELYKIFANDEILLRLLHYPSKNQRDNPLDVTSDKPNILEMKDLVARQKIIDNVLVARDKQLELDTSSKFSRVNFYLGNRIPKRTYSAGARQLINNFNVSDQEIIIDVHTNMEIDKVDFRMNWIIDRIRFLLGNRQVKQLIPLRFSDSYPISQTTKGFVGYKLIYYTVSTESFGCGEW